MLSGISIVCFATSYLVAWGLEVSRLLFRSGLRGALLQVFVALGILTHTVYLVNEARTAGSTAPLSSWHDWFLIAAWVLAMVYGTLMIGHPRVAIGVFVLPLVLGLIAAGYFWADTAPFPQSQASDIWATIHGGSLLLGTVVVLIGFTAGLMYLLQAWRLKRKLPPSERFRLPSLEWLERVNGRSITVSMMFLGLGVASGTILNQIRHLSDSQGPTIGWQDPVVWSSGLLFAWLLAVFVFELLYKPARSGRKVAYLTVGSFVFLMLVLALLPGGHDTNSNRQSSNRQSSRTRQSSESQHTVSRAAEMNQPFVAEVVRLRPGKPISNEIGYGKFSSVARLSSQSPAASATWTDFEGSR